MKLCKNCGHENPDDRTTCEACHRPLADKKPEYINMQTIRENGHDRPTDRQIKGGFDPKATLREGSLKPAYHVREETCPICGMTMEDGVCPHCGEQSKKDKEEVHADEDMPKQPPHNPADVRQTVRPQRKGEKEGTFTLIPISEDTGKPEGEPLQFEGNEVLLNRDNTDPKNKTITSLEQAILKHEDGNWTIKDASDYKTTFVQAADSITLKPGTIILLGNQLYEFNC